MFLGVLFQRSRVLNFADCSRGVLRCATAALLSISCFGCSSGTPGNLPNLSPVTGTVTLDGKPLADAYVNFAPENARPSSGQTDADGVFTLTFNDQLDGAAVGTHKVTITTRMVPSLPTAAPPPPVPPRYNINSELTATVKSGDNTIDFELTSS